MKLVRIYSCACCGSEVIYDTRENTLTCKCGTVTAGPNLDRTLFKRLSVQAPPEMTPEHWEREEHEVTAYGVRDEYGGTLK